MPSPRPSPLLLLPLVLLLGACAATAPTGDDDRRVEGNLVLEHVPEIPDALVERLRQYRSTRSASLAGWLPDGSALITTRFGETRQVHRIERPGGARTQLTFFDEPVSGVEPSPDAERPGFLFGRDAGGSEFWQVFHFDLASGTTTMLTDGTSRNASAVFAPDGARLAWASTRRNGVDTDVWLSGLDPDSARVLTTEGGSWFPIEFSPDGERLLVYRYVSRSEAYPYVVDVDDGSMRAVLPKGVTARIEEVGFAPDGQGLFLASDLGGEFVRLWRLDGPGADPEAISGRVAHDVEGFELSPDGRYLVWVVNEETLSRLYARDLSTGTFVALPRLPEGVVYGLAFTPDSRALGFTVNGSTSPGDVFSLDMDSRRLKRWTTSEVGGLDRERFVTPTHFRFPTFDALPGGGRDGDDRDARRTIPAYVYRPRGEGPHPVIVSIHGGPESHRTCVAPPATAAASTASTTAAAARTRCATSARCSTGSSAGTTSTRTG
jgi:dipeptidyl aminopeptidase/acylaminoacyl peptidase